MITLPERLAPAWANNLLKHSDPCDVLKYSHESSH